MNIEAIPATSRAELAVMDVKLAINRLFDVPENELCVMKRELELASSELDAVILIASRVNQDDLV